MVFFSLLDKVELEKEKEVVIEEINKNIDESIYWAHDLLETQMLGSHPLAHFILGTKKNIRDMNKNNLKNFIKNTIKLITVYWLFQVIFLKIIKQSWWNKHLVC